VDISLPHDTSDADFLRATDAAFARVAQVHALMSFHDAGSDLRAIARTSAGAALRVSADTCAVLRQSLALEVSSDGLFNVCVAPQLVRSGNLPEPGGALPAQGRTLAEALLLLPEEHVQVLNTPWIDLGGIAKGYAVDVAVFALQAAGMTQGLVNAGGDMRAFGAGTHPVHLRFACGLRHVADLHDSALATSCNAGPNSVHIDLRSTAPTRAQHSVMVHAPSAMLADAFTKIALLCPATANKLCQRAPDGLQTQWRAFDF
jgi:FAD:protein FMN transferase